MSFDPAAKEAQLAADASCWDTSKAAPAQPDDIPTVDISPWLQSGERTDLDAAATSVRSACETIGFFLLFGHGISVGSMENVLGEASRFHKLPVSVKRRWFVDNPNHSLGGVGYLPIGERRLPRRAVGNRNESFLLKKDKGIAWDDNQWPREGDLPGFRSEVQAYASAVESLARKLVQVFAAALDLDPHWFDEAFDPPFFRMRLNHYPPEMCGASENGAYGIAPHVDTSFFTILLQDAPGLTIHHALRGGWVHVPHLPGGLVVNTGELLRQWSNDRFVSVRHFANNKGASGSRYSIPIFFNASGDYLMECLPTCCGPENPPKYPAISYNQSQAIAQGE